MIDRLTGSLTYTFKAVYSPWSRCLISSICMLWLSASYANDTQPVVEQPTDNNVAPAPSIPYEQLALFSDLYHGIQQHYVDPLTDDAMFQHAIQGMLENIDPHSRYLSPEDHKELEQDSAGKYVGIGVYLHKDDENIIIRAVVEDSPADQASLLAGDSILSIDGQSVYKQHLDKVYRMLKGDADTEVTLALYRKQSDEYLTFAVTRALLPINSVKTKELEPGYWRLRLTRFNETTVKDALDAIEMMQAQKPIKGLVLDLRSNPGGLLRAAVGISDLFLSDGLIVYTQGQRGIQEQVFYAHDKTAVPKAPLVVLINQSSASASEIVAGALQDQGRAIVIGERSFGKGSVQNVFPLANGFAVKLTIARYYTPNGRSIQAQGIMPDMRIPSGELMVYDNPFTIREDNLHDHLKSENQSTNSHVKDSKRSSVLFTDTQDFQLYTALQTLKVFSQPLARPLQSTTP